MIIPLKVMRLRAGAAQTWRMSFFRRIAARGEHLSWTYDPVMRDFGAGKFPTFADLRFWPAATQIAVRSAPGTKPPPRLEVYGLSSSGTDRNLYQQADTSFQRQSTRALGADLSVPLTTTINFVGTLAPDFSNAEIDQETIKPQEFTRRLVEYRPFFAQGAQYVLAGAFGFTNFHGPRNVVFYSPSIGPFDRGAKIEGTYGLQSIGLLSFRGYNVETGEHFDDQAFGFRHALQDLTFQYWADGVLAHHSIAGDDTTIEAGASGRNPATGLQWWADEAVERRGGPGSLSAHSFNTAAFVSRRNYSAVAEYADISPAYAPLDGFTRLADLRGVAGFVNINGSTPGVKNWSIFLHGDRFVDRTGAVHLADANLLFNATFTNGFSVNGLGPQTSQLRGYDGNTFSGYPFYRNGATVPYNLFGIPLGYGAGTPRPIDLSANWGSFGGNWLHFYTAKTSRPLGARYTAGVEYDASYERSLTSGAADAQFLRSLLLGLNMGRSSNFTVALRGINGRGGFASNPGFNAAAAFHARMRSGDLYVNFGSPQSAVTLDRLIVKYILRFGGDAGT